MDVGKKAESRKKYEAPKLIVYGSAEEITKSLDIRNVGDMKVLLASAVAN